MQTKTTTKSTANVLLVVLGTILIVSLLGATVLRNTNTRLNVSTNQVRAWKDALLAAEAGGDFGFAEIRKAKGNTGYSWTGWTQVAATTTTPKKYIRPDTTFGSGNLMTRTVVEEIYFDSSTGQMRSTPLSASANPWYRVRSRGTAPLPGLKHTGMDDTIVADGLAHFATDGTPRGKGDSLLRKIDFRYDHFVASYGPNGDGLNKAQTAPPGGAASISRRIEQIIAPQSAFGDVAIKAAGTFEGLGNAAFIDSYNSNNGPYDRTIKNTPSHIYYSDSRKGSVQINSGVATIRGSIYGDVSTNNGTVTGRTSYVTGTIDNNVPFVLEDYKMPPTTVGTGANADWQYRAPGSGPGQLPASVTTTQILTPPSAGTKEAPNYYVINNLSGNLIINPVTAGPEANTYVAIRVTGDITGGITVNGSPVVPGNPTKSANVRVYFDGNIDVKARDLANRSPSATNPKAANLQFYGVSPRRDANGVPVRSQSIEINPNPDGILAATFYAPSASAQFNGNPDFIGAMVCKSFYSNGNNMWIYDRALNDEGEVLDYRIASYVEDIR